MLDLVRSQSSNTHGAATLQLGKKLQEKRVFNDIITKEGN